MIIEFNYDDFDEMYDEYFEVFDWCDRPETEEKDGVSIVIKDYRVVIPQLHVCYRKGDLYANEAEDDEEADWEPENSVVLFYEENEKDINKYTDYIDDGFEGMLLEKIIKRHGIEDFDGKCYIDTSEFLKPEQEKKFFPGNEKKIIFRSEE